MSSFLSLFGLGPKVAQTPPNRPAQPPKPQVVMAPQTPIVYPTRAALAAEKRATELALCRLKTICDAVIECNDVYNKIVTHISEKQKGLNSDEQKDNALYKESQVLLEIFEELEYETTCMLDNNVDFLAGLKGHDQNKVDTAVKRLQLFENATQINDKRFVLSCWSTLRKFDHLMLDEQEIALCKKYFGNVKKSQVQSIEVSSPSTGTISYATEAEQAALKAELEKLNNCQENTLKSNKNYKKILAIIINNQALLDPTNEKHQPLLEEAKALCKIFEGLIVETSLMLENVAYLLLGIENHDHEKITSYLKRLNAFEYNLEACLNS